MKMNQGKRMMIVDDDEESRLAIREVCKDFGFSVTTTDDGAWALKQLQEDDGRWFSVVSSWKMPKMSGNEFLRKAIQIKVPVQNWVLMTAITAKQSDDLKHLLDEFPEIQYLKKPAVVSDFFKLMSSETH